MRSCLVSVACLAFASCSVPEAGRNDSMLSLQDGIYPVVKRETAGTTATRGARIVELVEAPVTGSIDATPQTVLVIDEPVLRFREVPHHEFKFDQNNECTQIELENTESLKAFTRNHIGGRLAVVVDGKVVSSHKIRNPVETKNVTITFCTEGGGDEVYRHLKSVLPPSRQ